MASVCVCVCVCVCVYVRVRVCVCVNMFLTLERAQHTPACPRYCPSVRLLQLLDRILSLFLIDVHFVHFSPRPVARPASRPSIAQLVERRTVVESTDILRALVRLSL